MAVSFLQLGAPRGVSMFPLARGIPGGNMTMSWVDRGEQSVWTQQLP